MRGRSLTVIGYAYHSVGSGLLYSGVFETLPRDCPNVVGGHLDLRDCSPINQLIKRGIEVWIVLQPTLVGRDIRVSHHT